MKEKIADWFIDDGKVQGYIKMCLQETMKHLVQDEARGTWVKLQSTYKKTGWTHTYAKWQELHRWEFHPSQEPLSQINKLTMILDELVTLEVTIIEKVKVMMVLQKLPQSYQGLISTVLGMTELSKIDIPYITTLLRNEYEHHKNLTGKNRAVVNMAHTDLRKHTSHPPWQKNAQA